MVRLRAPKSARADTDTAMRQMRTHCLEFHRIGPCARLTATDFVARMKEQWTCSVVPTLLSVTRWIVFFVNSNRNPPRQRATAQAGAIPGLILLCAGLVYGKGAAANDDALYLVCPCTVESDGTTLSLTAGIRSFKPRDSTPLSLGVRTEYEPGIANTDIEIATVAVADSVAARATLETATYEVAINTDSLPGRDVHLDLVLYEGTGDRPDRHDRVRMDSPVDLSGSFQVDDLDFLEDTDGDGVGDINERLEGTDPSDSASTPGDSTIDVLALFSEGISERYGGDPTTRIQHLFTLANEILSNSEAQLSFRLVGLAEVQLDESSRRSRPERAVQDMEAERHGADLLVLFREPAPSQSVCGYADLGSYKSRGRFEFSREHRSLAVVLGGCGAGTLAHELGHVMGLGHSVWQVGNVPVGTWRWSRGHAVDHDFGTIMTYGPQHGAGTRLEVFSDPQSLCTGAQDQASPCGVDGEEVNGADAVTSLNATRFQIARFRESKPDADGDGYVDPVDTLPNDSTEWRDTDGDGIGNNKDTDDDGDGVGDLDDIFPLDATESADSDKDGVGDNADAFPQDPDEVSDLDGDGVGDNADAFPEDPAETLDTDNDGVGDNADAFPQDSGETADTDGDGIGDNADSDADDDGVLDGLDLFPLDADRSSISSYVFFGEQSGDFAGEILAAGGDGDQQRLVVGVPHHKIGELHNAGAVYLVAAAELAALDAADGRTDRAIGLGHVTAGANSWKLVGDAAYDSVGRSVFTSGDLDGDDLTDLLVGASGEAGKGAAYLVSGADLAAADAADGVSDHVIQLDRVSAQPNSWKFLGEADNDEAGRSVAALPDAGSDGKAELLIGAWRHRLNAESKNLTGAVYRIASSDLRAADAADGTEDRVVDLGNVSGGSASWKLVDETSSGAVGTTIAAVDIDGDGNTEIVASAPEHPAVRPDGKRGAIYVIAASDLALADAADGEADRVVDLSHVTQQPDSWKLVDGPYNGWVDQQMGAAGTTADSVGWMVAGGYVVSATDLAAADAADGDVDGVVEMPMLIGEPDSWRVVARVVGVVGDTDGDGGDDLLVSDYRASRVTAHLVPTARLADLDNVGQPADGAIYVTQLVHQAGIWTLSAQFPNGSVGTASAGDVNGDGRADHLLGNPWLKSGDTRGVVHLLLSADVSGLDWADGLQDRRMMLENLAGDTDGDGMNNTFDRDDDNDGFEDDLDRFPLDNAEWADSDGDGVGDNTDELPQDPWERYDTDGDGLGDSYQDDDDDGDGIPDHEDAYPLDTDNDGTNNEFDADDDNDGIVDADDDFPLDPGETTDTDRDGIGNAADTDDDGDGVADSDDALPLDARDSVDTDGDGIGDNTDAFPNDAAETADFDSDGTGDNADTDDDNDGVADVDDDYPFDAGASTDTDGDGVPDSRDRYPTHPGEWENTDNSGFGDNRDTDDDNDGVLDVDDLFPKDRSRSDLSSFRLKLGDEVTAYTSNNVASAGDLDGDGKPELLIRPPATGINGEGGEVFIVSPGILAGVDTADGRKDGSLFVRYAPSLVGSWKLVGEAGYTTGTFLPGLRSLGDLGGDGKAEIFIGASAPTTSTSYIVSGASLLAADAADTMADGTIDLGLAVSQPGSWKLRGRFRGFVPQASRPGDIDGDGSMEMAIAHPGAGSGDSPGSVYVIAVNSLAGLDALDGATDGQVSTVRGTDSARWHLVGEAPGDRAGSSVIMSNFDGDGNAELVVGAPGHDTNQLNEGAIYLISGEDLPAADLADGAVDGMVELGRIAAEPNSWKLASGSSRAYFGGALSTGDVDGDGHQDLVLFDKVSLEHSVGRVIPWNGERFGEMDEADGAADGVIALENIDGTAGSFTTPPIPAYDPAYQMTDLTDFDGDGMEDLLIGVGGYTSGPVALLIAASSIVGETTAATTFDTWWNGILGKGGSYSLHAPELSVLQTGGTVSIASAGDVDGDGLGDIVLGMVPNENGRFYRAAYLINAADLPHLDAADGNRDGRIFLSSMVRPRR